MKKLLRKKGIIYGAIVVLLGAALYLNWSYIGAPEDLLSAEAQDGAGSAQSAEAAETPQASENDFFTSSRLSREQARDEALSILKETAANESADESSKEQANAQITVLAENSVKEADVESLIRAKGYAEAVVMIGDGSVNVVVATPEQGFTATDANVIKDIVMQETGAAADTIKIVEAS